MHKFWIELKGKWVEKLPGVLWAYRTTKRIPTGETLFSLANRTKAIIPIDFSMSTLFVEGVDQDKNDVQLCLILDQSEEKRQQAQIHIATYQQQIRTAHHKVKVHKSQVGDLVLKHVIQTTRQKDQGKLGPLHHFRSGRQRVRHSGCSRRENPRAIELFLFETILCVESCNI